MDTEVNMSSGFLIFVLLIVIAGFWAGAIPPAKFSTSAAAPATEKAYLRCVGERTDDARLVITRLGGGLMRIECEAPRR